MNTIRNVKVAVKDRHIDQAVVKEAFNSQAWEKEVEVIPKLTPTSIRLSTRTIARAKLFARIHQERGYQSWLKKIVEERVNSEYDLYKSLKREAV
jgi:hypothetical protein